MFEIGQIDGSAWVAILIWFLLWLTLVSTGLFLTQREKRRGRSL